MKWEWNEADVNTMVFRHWDTGVNYTPSMKSKANDMDVN